MAGTTLKDTPGIKQKETTVNALTEMARNTLQEKQKAGNICRKSETNLKVTAGNNLKEKYGHILKKAGNSQKKKAGNSLKEKAGSNGSKWTGNSLKKAWLSLAKTIGSKKTANSDAKGKERPLVSVFSRKKKVQQRRKSTFRISRSVSEDSTTTLNLDTYSTHVPPTEERKSFLFVVPNICI